MGAKAKRRNDLTDDDRKRALERDLGVYLRGPSFVDEEIEDLEKQLARAAEAGSGATLELSPRAALCLHLALTRGRSALRIIRELAAETFRLPGMRELAERRRDEILAANYEALRVGGESGDGLVTLRRPDEAQLGIRGTSDTAHHGGPLSPREACEALAEWTGEPYERVRKQLRAASARFTAPDDPKLGDLPPGR